MKRYNIVADYIIEGKPFTCIVYGSGRNKEIVEKVLKRIIMNPTPEDIFSLGNGKNVRIEETEEVPWWEEGQRQAILPPPGRQLAAANPRKWKKKVLDNSLILCYDLQCQGGEQRKAL